MPSKIHFVLKGNIKLQAFRLSANAQDTVRMAKTKTKEGYKFQVLLCCFFASISVQYNTNDDIVWQKWDESDKIFVKHNENHNETNVLTREFQHS